MSAHSWASRPTAGGSARLPRDVAAAAVLLVVAAWISVEAHGGKLPRVLPEATFVSGVTVGLFAICGYPVAHRLVGSDLRSHLALIVLPTGAATSALALTMLGFLGVPLAISIAAILLVALVACVLSFARRPPAPAPHPPTESRRTLARPLLLAAALAFLALLPLFRIGELAVPGENPDAHLVTGAAEVVREGPPNAIQPDLPVDRVSIYWQSKYPIYYTLSAVSALSGREPVEVFPIVSAILFGLFGLGVYLFAVKTLRAPPLAGLLALGIVTADRVVLYLVEHPYYNQLWGTFAFPFMLLLGFQLLRRPSRATTGLFALFFGLGVLAYPLMLPFPAVVLGVAGVLEMRRRGALARARVWLRGRSRPRLRRALVLGPPLAVVFLILLLLVVAGMAKGVMAVRVILPGGSLHAWAGDSPDWPFAHYFGLPAVPGPAAVAFCLLVLAAVAGLRQLDRPERVGLSVMCAGAFLMGVSFLGRVSGEYFAFKTFAFLGPVVLALAVVGAFVWGRESGTPRRRVAVIALAALSASAAVGLRDGLRDVPIQTPPETVALRGWAQQLPRGGSIRIDVPPNTVQLWAAYMLHERPLSASRPVVNTTYPYLPVSRRADYVLVDRTQRRPPDAAGAPVRANAGFRLYRMRGGVPGPDRSSRRRLQPQ